MTYQYFLPIKNRWFLSSNIIGRDISCLSSWVLHSPPMLWVVDEKKSFISFHIKFLQCDNHILLRSTISLIELHRHLRIIYRISYLVSLCNVIIFGDHILWLISNTATWWSHVEEFLCILPVTGFFAVRLRLRYFQEYMEVVSSAWSLTTHV